MSRSTTVGRTAAAVITAAALAGSGLATASAQASGHTGGDRSTVTSVRIVKHRVHMPTTVRAGFHTFHVKSKNGDFQLVKILGHYTPQEFAHDANKGINGGSLRYLRRLNAHVVFLGGTAATAGHPNTVQLRVPRGTIWAVDTAPDKAKPSAVLPLHVVGPAAAGRPTGAETITAVDPDRWSSSDPQSIPTSGTLLFKNDSHANHFVVIGKLAAGKTITDFGNWVNAANAGKATFDDAPVDQSAPGYFDAIVSPGHASSDHYSLPAGNYVIACFYPESDTGMPHVLMGMYQGVTVQ